MALHDADRKHTTGSRFDPRTSAGFTPYIVGTALLVAGYFYFFTDTFSTRTTLPPTVTSVPQTTTPVPATK